jgi:hypothetical protein
MLNSCAKPLLAEEPLDTFERPYVYTIVDGEVIKKVQKYPDLTWKRGRNGYSCINQGDFIYLIQFLIQVNGVITQYEDKERGGVIPPFLLFLVYY